MKFKLTILLFSFLILQGNASKKNVEEEVVDLNAIKNVIENDNLSQHLAEKQEKEKKLAEKKQAAEVRKFNIPTEEEFLTLLSEYWLIKNVSVLKWDFTKPDYGINLYFKNFLEKIGIINFEFRILLVNTPMVTHFALPSRNSEGILLLSLPFIRTLDLSKLEISLLLLEDLLRLEAKYFKSKVLQEADRKLLGTNYHKKELNVEKLDTFVKRYDDLIYEKGFSFKQQFEVTKKMDRLLKGNLKLWNKYYLMVQKIKELSDTNYLYKHHVKIYPSPELQLNWLKPTEK